MSSVPLVVLEVKVQPSGNKVFYFRYYVEKEKYIQLGIWPEMKLATANISKNKREYLFRLTEPALQELASVKELTKESNSPYIFPLLTNGERPVRTGSLARPIMYFRAFNPEFKFFTARDLRRICKISDGLSRD